MSRPSGRTVVTALACAAVAVGCGGEPPAVPPPTDAPTDACAPVEEGYRSLFDGTEGSLDTWRMAGPGGFELREDCSMVTVGGMGLLWFPETFDSYRLRLDWRMEGDDNSGVFVGFPDPGDDPWLAVTEGYEVQIDPTDQPDSTTGAIYSVQGADLETRDDVLNPPGEWNSYELVVEGPRLVVYLNDVLVNDFVSSDPARLPGGGHIGLQNHADGDEVFFRSVRLAESAD